MRRIVFIVYGECKVKKLHNSQISPLLHMIGCFRNDRLHIIIRNAIIPHICRNGTSIYPQTNTEPDMTERKYLRWKKCLICDDFVKLMFPEDSKNMLIIYEPVEGRSDASKNWRKKQLGYIDRDCLGKAASVLKEQENTV